MIESRVSSWYAFATVLLLSSRSLASWRIEGSESPGFRTPAVTAALICSMSCSNCGRGLSMSMVISIGGDRLDVPVEPMVQLAQQICNLDEFASRFSKARAGDGPAPPPPSCWRRCLRIFFQALRDALGTDLHRARRLGGVEILL